MEIIGDCVVPAHHYKDSDGYNRIKYKSRAQGLHRVIWKLCFGEIPDDKVVCHRCNNKGCVNPLHLYLASSEQNSTDAARDRLYQTGSEHHMSRFSAHDIADIFIAYHELDQPQQFIAKNYGCSQSIISSILRGRAYATVSQELIKKYEGYNR